MPKMLFAGSESFSLSQIVGLFQSIGDEATLQSSSATRVTYTLGPTVLTADGTGFAVESLNGTSVLTDGVITDLVVDIDGSGQKGFGLFDIDTSVFSIQRALFLESLGTNSALDDLVLSLDWVYKGKAGIDVVEQTVFADDGAALSFRGNDLFLLRAGNDSVFAGEGNDTVKGGGGDDWLGGGAGEDRLFGGGGNDTLLGGAGDDRLRGNSGSDLFVFETGGGTDVVLDFEDGIDLLDFRGVTAEIVVGQHELGALLTMGEDRVLLFGVDSSLVTEADFA